jgi:hypothetical protein
MMRRFSGSATPVAPIASVLATAATPAADASCYPNVPDVAGASTVGHGINAYETARYVSSARHVGLALIASLVLIAATGCGATSTKTVTPASTSAASGTASPGAWTGLGAKLSDWETAHPKNSTGCSAGGCYGARVMADGSLMDQFVLVSTTGAPEYRVDGYEQAIGDGTPLATAKAAVLGLLPKDTRTTAFWIAHTETGSCALWNLQSKTLGQWFGGKKVGDPQGHLGIVLASATTEGTSAFAPNNVPHASINIAPEEKGGNC